MERINLPVNQLVLKSIDIWRKQWILLTAGDFKSNSYNAMTIAWGSFGYMWNKPFAQVVVRPTRYTFEFMNKYDSFTLTVFPEKYKPALQLLGTKSGRDTDKIQESGLFIIPSEKVSAPGFNEAELIIECKKIYWQDFNPENFVDKSIKSNYPLSDYHRIYFGEIVNVNGLEQYINGGL